jgi:hypothetical protein
MGQGISHLPHITHVKAGNNKWDPIHKSIFEVYFTLPTPIASEFSADAEILTEQVTKVSGLDALQKTTSAGQQKFMGVDVSFLNPVMDNTYAEIEMDLNLNLRDGSDAYVLKLFKAWAKLGYDMSDGTRTLKADYMTDSLRIAEANRDGTIWRSYVFKHVMLTEVSVLGDLDYSTNDAVSLKVKFRADWWEAELA